MQASALAYGGVSLRGPWGEGKRWTPEPTRSYPPVATARTEASLLIPKRVIGNDQVIGLAPLVEPEQAKDPLHLSF
jgi:hypothetical protein